MFLEISIKMDLLADITFMTIAVRSCVFILFFYLSFGLYQKWINGTRFNKCTPECKNKVAIITGASHGIGRVVALHLASRGVCVILACRNKVDGINAQQQIILSTGNTNVFYMYLDLSSFDSIRMFADSFLSTGSRLDILINNTSLLQWNREVTIDGLEKTIGVNHFGPFLLSTLLVERLSQSTPSRIINVAQWAHWLYDIDPMDLMNQNRYDPYKAYTQSQLASLYFSFAFSKKLSNTGITCNVVHPGFSVKSFIIRSRLNDRVK